MEPPDVPCGLVYLGVQLALVDVLLLLLADAVRQFFALRRLGVEPTITAKIRDRKLNFYIAFRELAGTTTITNTG